VSARIEIRQQPEHRRWRAEVEIGGMPPRSRNVTSPSADGLAGIIALVRETYAALLPQQKLRTAPPAEEPMPRLRNVDERRWGSVAPNPPGDRHNRWQMPPYGVGDVGRDTVGQEWLWLGGETFKPYPPPAPVENERPAEVANDPRSLWDFIPSPYSHIPPRPVMKREIEPKVAIADDERASTGE
jgi:hypothetical protein